MMDRGKNRFIAAKDTYTTLKNYYRKKYGIWTAEDLIIIKRSLMEGALK